MLPVLAITVPIYACVAVGYLAVRRKVFARDDMRVLSTFVINFALPCMLFLALGTRHLADIVNPAYLTAYAIGSNFTYAVGWLWGRAAGHSAAVRAFDGLGMAGCNSGFVGYPLMLLTFPESAGLILGLSMIVENLVVLPMMYLLVEGRAGAQLSAGQRLAAYGRRLTRNPLLIGLAAGLLVSVSGLALPDVVVRTADLFARTGAAMALFAIGGLLTRLPRGADLRRVLVISAGKLVVHPAAVVAALLIVTAIGMPSLAPQLRMALILTGALPVFSIAPVLALPYGEEEPMAGVLLVTTAGSFLTLSALLAVLVG